MAIFFEAFTTLTKSNLDDSRYINLLTNYFSHISRCFSLLHLQHPKQCEIPDDFKDSTGFEPVDVMAFLGIRRAEPLRVERNQPDWE
jgi:hypothetical protein